MKVTFFQLEFSEIDTEYLYCLCTFHFVTWITSY